MSKSEFGIAASELIRDKQWLARNEQRSIINRDRARAIELAGFTLEEAQPWINGLQEKTSDPQVVLQAILEWTGGNPILIQRLHQLIREFNERIPTGQETQWVANLVQNRIVENWEEKDHLGYLKQSQSEILKYGGQRSLLLLERYIRVLHQREILADNSTEQIDLRLSGLVIKQQGRLRLPNRIYKAIFDLNWVAIEIAKLRKSEAMPGTESVIEQKPRTQEITILFLTVIARDVDRLRSDQKIREIRNQLDRSKRRERFTVHHQLITRPSDLQRAILNVRPMVVHFFGNGIDEALIFEDDNGSFKVVSSEALAQLFRLFTDRIQCVVLDRCYSDIQGKHIAQHCYVVGISRMVDERRAIEFAGGFYDALGDGRDYESAFRFASSTLLLQETERHLMPILLKESGQVDLTIGTLPTSDLRTGSLSILLLSVYSDNINRLHLDQEVREINEGLMRSQQRDRVRLECKSAVRYSDLRRTVLGLKPRIIHFTGGRTDQQGLALEDGTGQIKLVSVNALATLFKPLQDQVECVVLNVCYSIQQAEAIAQHINYVIGIKRGISDRAAIDFMIGFYDALGAGQSIEFAYQLGCNSLQLAGIPEHLTPVLQKKSNLA